MSYHEIESLAIAQSAARVDIIADDEPETDILGCPCCGTPNEPLGALGWTVHYRCACCGLMYHADVVNDD